MYLFSIYSAWTWNLLYGLLSPSFRKNATKIFISIGNTTFENQATIIYGLEKFTLESFSVNKRDMKIEVGIKIPIIKVRKINFKLLFCSTSSSIYGTCFSSAKLLFTYRCRGPSLLLHVDRLYTVIYMKQKTMTKVCLLQRWVNSTLVLTYISTFSGTCSMEGICEV